MQLTISNKLTLLKLSLSKLNSLIVSFSGGIDSSFLLKVAKSEVKGEVIGITAKSPIRPDSEIEVSKKIAKEIDVKHIIIETNEIDDVEFIKNRKERCYICKKILFLKLKEMAKPLNIKNIAYGENFDDLERFRPGRKAAIEEDILAPLVDAKLTKVEIQKLAKDMNLSNWNKPPFSCLAAQVPYGEKLTFIKKKPG